MKANITWKSGVRPGSRPFAGGGGSTISGRKRDSSWCSSASWTARRTRPRRSSKIGIAREGSPAHRHEVHEVADQPLQVSPRPRFRHRDRRADGESRPARCSFGTARPGTPPGGASRTGSPPARWPSSAQRPSVRAASNAAPDRTGRRRRSGRQGGRGGGRSEGRAPARGRTPESRSRRVGPVPLADSPCSQDLILPAGEVGVGGPTREFGKSGHEGSPSSERLVESTIRLHRRHQDRDRGLRSRRRCDGASTGGCRVLVLTHRACEPGRAARKRADVEVERPVERPRPTESRTLPRSSIRYFGPTCILDRKVATSPTRPRSRKREQPAARGRA